MTKPTIPAKDSRSHALLTELQKGPGTFYQICERADIDIESKTAERNARMLFDTLLDAGYVSLCRMTFSITAAARIAMNPPAPYVGQMAGPAYRGVPHPSPVLIVKRATGARA